MRKSDIKLQLSTLRPTGILALLRNVGAKMKDNSNFATPAVPLVEMTNMADDLSTAIEVATHGGRQSKLDRNQLVTEAIAMLNKQAAYVRSQCAGEAVKLASSGFALRRHPAPVGIPGQAGNMLARITGLPGQLELKWDSVSGAHGYQVWMTDKDPELQSSWQAVGYTTRVRHLVTDLEAYKAYWFCVSAIGTAGEGAQNVPAMNRAA